MSQLRALLQIVLVGREPSSEGRFTFWKQLSDSELTVKEESERRRDTTQFSQEPGKLDLNAALQKEAFWSDRPPGESFQSNAWMESSAGGS